MRYKELFRALSECEIGVLVLSEDNIIVDLNEKAEELLHGNGHLVGRDLPKWARVLAKDQDYSQYAKVAFGEYLVRQPVPVPDDLPAYTRWIGFRSANRDYMFDVLETVINKMSEGLVVCDSEGRLNYYNDSGCKMDSVVEENVRGLLVSQVYTMEDGKEMILPEIVKTRKPVLNLRQRYISTKSGKNKDVVSNAYPVIKNGQLLAAFNIVEDYTTITDLHEQIAELRAELLNMSSGHNDSKSPFTAKYTFEDIICQSDSMKSVIDQCRQVAKTDSAIMFYGETGTGKELFAQSIHNASNRKDGPFLAINCAALPENLLESILFGSVKGAYTGAETRAGLFEQANHGTLLLDEINSMDINLQAKLLRVLQDGKIRRVGGDKTIQVDVRIISNTNMSPYQAIKEGKLRQDLFYRLGVVNINIPPLRERKGDIPILVEHFIHVYRRKYLKSVQSIDKMTLGIFETYDWPGNVRELHHAVEHAVIVLPENVMEITPEYIPQHLLSDDDFDKVEPAKEEEADPSDKRDQLIHRLEDVEKDTIIRILKNNKGNISKSAKVMEMSRQNLQYRIKRYHIDVKAIKESTKEEHE